jgi:hypothetical protein
MKGHMDVILQIYINEFSDNAYVIKYKKEIFLPWKVVMFCRKKMMKT